jgi:elongation factor G
MPKYRTKDIRNIALVGHTGAGKTTLAEALLAGSGTKGEAGTIERGTTTMDHDPLEKKYHHSLDSALASLDFQGMHLNLIDTAGFPDFRGPTLASLTAVETTAIVVNAHNGVELSTRRLMRRAKRRRLCRMIIINRIDAEGVDLKQVVEDLRSEFGPECLPVNLPADNLSKVRDCFYQTDGETDVFSLSEAHEAIIDHWCRSALYRQRPVPVFPNYWTSLTSWPPAPRKAIRLHSSRVKVPMQSGSQQPVAPVITSLPMS